MIDLPTVDNIGLKGEQISAIVLQTLHRPSKIPGVDPTVLIFLYWLMLRLPEDFELFKY